MKDERKREKERPFMLILAGLKERLGGQFYRIYMEACGYRNEKSARSAFRAHIQKGFVPRKNKSKIAGSFDIPLDDIENQNIDSISAKIADNNSIKNLLPHTFSENRRKLCGKVFSNYKGVYKAKFSWVVPYISNPSSFCQNGEYKKALYTVFLSIDNYSKNDLFIKVKMTTSTHFKNNYAARKNEDYDWEWNGFLIPIEDDKHYIVLENKMFSYPITIYLCASKGRQINDTIKGIYITNPTVNHKCKGTPPSTSATEIFLKFFKRNISELSDKDYNELSIKFNDEPNNEIDELKNRLDIYELLSTIPK